jgi:organic radical activating enzyme
MTIESIVSVRYEKFQKQHNPLIVITGGEPMRQNISPICRKFIELGHIVQVETNGTILCPDLPKEVKIVCSPKVTNGKYHNLRQEIIERTIAIKFIVSANIEGYDDIANIAQGPLIYIQPMDEYDPEKNQRNLELAMRLCDQYNAILSLQTHKMIGIE